MQHEKIIDGKALAESTMKDLKDKVSNCIVTKNIPPCLAVVLVGTRADSATYVRMKQRAAERIGIVFRLLSFDEQITQSELEQHVRDLDADESVHGIIVQLPLPKGIDEYAVTQLINANKDVDGFHIINLGGTFMSSSHKTLFTPCTARGVMEMLDRECCDTKLEGACVILIGSGMVGKPLCGLLMKRNATVICCNKYTKNIEHLCRHGDVVIAAAGSPLLVKKEWVKPGAVVIDVGINSISDPSRKTGRRLVGDVDFDNVAPISSRISPVPGGVGPMTVAMLMKAVVESWQRNHDTR